MDNAVHFHKVSRGQYKVFSCFSGLGLEEAARDGGKGWNLGA